MTSGSFTGINHHAIQQGEQVKTALLSQVTSEVLTEENTIEEEFYQAVFQSTNAIKNHLAKYGFGEDLLSHKIYALSGGEKNLLQLARIAVSKANLLLLDEPTSHLDTNSQLALEEALKNFHGAVLMIFHDFYTIVNCMDYVLLIEDNTIRKVSMRKFRKIIYANNFNKDYLEIEQKKQAVENIIAVALKNKDIVLTRKLAEGLEELNQKL